MTDTTNIVMGVFASPGEGDLIEMGDVARSDVPLDPDQVDTVPNIPHISNHMRDPRGHDDEPTPAA